MGKRYSNEYLFLLFLSYKVIECRLLRRGRDSNSRAPFEADGFQDRWFKPLTHPSSYRYEMSHVVTV